MMHEDKMNVVLAVFLVSFASLHCQTKHLHQAPGASESSMSIMLAGDWVPENTHDIAFDRLTKVASQHSIVSDVRDAGGTRINQHNYLVYHDGRFWAMWSDGPGKPHTTPDRHRDRVPGHDREGQRISYAVSDDGINWSRPRDLAGAPDPEFGWIARGFWKRNGQLLALVCRYNAPDYRGQGLQLHAFIASQNGDPIWQHHGLVYDNAMNNFPPRQLPNGEWMMSRRDSVGDVYFMVGGTEAFDQWTSHEIIKYEDDALAAEEPYWWILPDDRLVGLFRDNRKSGFLFRAFSHDHGRSWSKPHKTNFPDATSKFCGTQLPDGRYVLVSNPNPKKRDPLVISVSHDGLTFHKMGYLVGGRHVDYPHVIVHDDHLYVAFSSAKQSVEVLKISLSALDR